MLALPGYLAARGFARALARHSIGKKTAENGRQAQAGRAVRLLAAATGRPFNPVR
jgi:hypothetical protein